MPEAVEEATAYVDAVAPLISANPEEGDVVDSCHLIDPVLPLKVKVLAVPLQVLPAPPIVPATDTAFTVITADPLLPLPGLPLASVTDTIV